MAADMIKIEHRHTYVRGCDVSCNGRIYVVDEATGLLHRVMPGGRVMAEAGVPVDEVEAFKRFPTMFRVLSPEAPAVPPTPAPAPPPPAAPTAPPPPVKVAEPEPPKPPEKPAEPGDEAETPEAGEGSSPEPPAAVYLGLLDSPIPVIESTLATGNYDGVLDALIEAENNGKTRVGALRALNERKAAI